MTSVFFILENLEKFMLLVSAKNQLLPFQFFIISHLVDFSFYFYFLSSFNFLEFVVFSSLLRTKVNSLEILFLSNLSTWL
jgi:hypothetical protein